MKRILILGADGYLGWSVAKKSSQLNNKLILVDSGLRRKLVDKVGSNSLTPIADFKTRASKLNNVLNAYEFDITDSEKLNELFLKYSPDIIINLAQQASAPYSMYKHENANFTLINNEIGNMNVLWAIKKYSKESLYIKLGSFGEYAPTNIEVAEGYFKPTYKGVESNNFIPFPRKSGDFYHASKANDSNYLAVASDVWGLRIVELMQSTIFGCRISEDDMQEGLITRYDYDQFFGTVVNRFILQSLVNEPLTVYGNGTHRTGIMSLSHAVEEILHIIRNEDRYNSEHKVINNSPSVDFTVNELAELIKSTGESVGIKKIRIKRVVNDGFDPRNEKNLNPERRVIATSTIGKIENLLQFSDYVKKEILHLEKYTYNYNPNVLHPTFNWAE